MAETTFVDIDTAKKIVQEKYPDAINTNFLEHGYDNLVCLVDDKYAIKFPRYEFAYIRDKYEKIVLEELSSLKEITIPKVLGEGQNPPYLITSYVEGEHLADDDINNLSKEQQENFSNKLAKFAFSVHSLLTVEKAIADQNKIGMNDFNFYDYMLKDFQFPTSEQDSVAKDFYNRWKNLQYNNPKVVIHDDLNSLNLIFKENALVGVIDFGDAKIGYPEQEFRQLYRINEFILQSVIDCYKKLSGHQLDIEAVKINAIIHELSLYASKLSSNKTDHPGFINARELLQRWFPECSW